MIDTVDIKIKSGDGGDGIVSFRREKYRPYGGPDGGDGGKGGSVILIADENLHTLRDFRAKPEIYADNGERGKENNMFGKDAKDLYVRIPVGTLVYEIKSGVKSGSKTGNEILVGDFNSHGQELVLAKGGQGGKGNFRFRSSTNQTPTQFTRGGSGISKILRLEIKLVADVGIIGLPNAGKSTLINFLTRADAKVANYPFTTLEPNLGVAIFQNKKIVFADIPGLIEGASSGKGLGDEFLRHVERNKVLIHLIDPIFDAENNGLIDYSLPNSIEENVWKNYQIIRNELEKYKSKFVSLISKPEIIVVNKLDITEIRENKAEITKIFQLQGFNKVFFISAFTGEGVSELLEEVSRVNSDSPEVSFEKKKPVKIIHIQDLKNKRMIYNTVEDLGPLA